ncbi:unnamed protein product [Boreogadus saida]
MCDQDGMRAGGAKIGEALSGSFEFPSLPNGLTERVGRCGTMLHPLAVFVLVLNVSITVFYWLFILTEAFKQRKVEDQQPA